MDIIIGKKAVVWSYTAQILNYSSYVILLPLILKVLSPKEVGLWYIFISITALVNVMDFGFLPNITRSINYIYSGASYLSREGISVEQLGGSVNVDLLKSLISVVKKIYRYITILLAFLLIIGGTFYLKSIISHTEIRLWGAFYLFTLSVILNFFYSYYDALLLGKGLIKEANQAISISKITFLIVATAGILFGLGLLGIALASVISVFVNRILYHNRFYNQETKDLLSTGIINNQKELFYIIWFNAKKLGMASIGVFLIFQANLLIAGKYYSLPEVASLGLTIQLFSAVVSFSRLYFNTFMPRFNSLRIRNQMETLKKEFLKSMLIGWIIYLTGLIVITLAGSFILEVIKSKTSLPNIQVILLFGFVFLMEVVHGNCAAFLTTRNTVPFLGATLITGGAIIVLNFTFILIFHFGISGFAVSTIIAQLCYNAWRWPLVVIADLKIKFKDFFLSI